jgi:DNA-binding transcriptional MocR family regulator
LGNYARLCFAYYDSPQLEEGVNRLARALSEYL